MEAASSDEGIMQARERGVSVSEGEEDRSPTVVAMANSTHYQQRRQYQAPQAPRRWHARVAQNVERWIFLYNVTTGLYMLDWWERCIFNAVFVVFFAVAGYNSGHYLQRIGAGLLAWAWWGDSCPVHEGLLAGADAGAGAGTGVG